MSSFFVKNRLSPHKFCLEVAADACLKPGRYCQKKYINNERCHAVLLAVLALVPTIFGLLLKAASYVVSEKTRKLYYGFPLTNEPIFTEDQFKLVWGYSDMTPLMASFPRQPIRAPTVERTNFIDTYCNAIRMNHVFLIELNGVATETTFENILDNRNRNNRNWIDHWEDTSTGYKPAKDNLLESCHQYIQFFFPIQTYSANCPQAPVFYPGTEAKIKELTEDPKAHALRAACFSKYMNFLGIEVVGEEGSLKLVPSADFFKRFTFWATDPIGTHNLLRIDRCLKHLELFGETERLVKLREFLQRLQAMTKESHGLAQYHGLFAQFHHSASQHWFKGAS